MTGRGKRARRRPRAAETPDASVVLAIADERAADELAEAITRRNGTRVTVLPHPSAVKRLVRRPSIMVLEIDADGDGHRQLRDIAADDPRLHIVAIGGDGGDVLSVLESGATCVLGPDAGARDVAQVVEDLQSEGVRLDPRITTLVIRRMQELSRICKEDGIDFQTCGRLSGRERSVIELLSQGMGNQQIADALQVSVGTVKTHVHHVLRKLDVENRRTAGAYWRLFRQGLKPEDSPR